MPERPIGVTDVASGADVADYRTRERTVGGVSVVEQYLICRKERVQSFIGAAATFRTAASATHSGSIFNAAGSTVLVAVLSVEVWGQRTANSGTLYVQRVGRCTTAPTGGVVIDKVSVGTGADAAETSSASVEVRSAGTADGTGTALTVTETARLAHFGQTGRMNSLTLEHSPMNLGLPVGWDTYGTFEQLDEMDWQPLAILRAGEGLASFVDSTASTGSVGLNILWEEYTLP